MEQEDVLGQDVEDHIGKDSLLNDEPKAPKSEDNKNPSNYIF